MNVTWEEVVNADYGHVYIDRFEDGLRFLVLRGPGSLCAYVGLAKDHPLAGKSYDDLPVDCHGGLTYSGDSLKGAPEGYWWYGWDYAHCDDQSTYTDRIEGKQWTPEEVDKDSWHALYDFKKLVRLAEQIARRPVRRSDGERHDG